MTAENLKTRMRNPRFGVVYRNFQLSWAKVRNKEITKPLWQPKELGNPNITASKKTEPTLYSCLQLWHNFEKNYFKHGIAAYYIPGWQPVGWFSDFTIDLIEAFHAKIFRLNRYIYIQFSLEQHTTIKTPWCLQKQLRGDAINVVFKSHQQILPEGKIRTCLVRSCQWPPEDTLIAAGFHQGRRITHFSFQLQFLDCQYFTLYSIPRL